MDDPGVIVRIHEERPRALLINHPLASFTCDHRERWRAIPRESRARYVGVREAQDPGNARES
jgi:hypothetical protein